ncbi:16S rRNA (uracil(1498)-N(3))-methyltransferase [Treponema ruminis]|uniref:Ribosomal RNA small subunit methyltransferase E n=1 Tax=Treponema ruminis TaxID=744515 RepID=A0A7W8GAR3_9SPIR|nr:RsmE family RNA methyltransferase [Treponema ruminis]MBB5226978.1 16S rRNA (uracil1498-N3)-methyltransferase [Treponema ruminis]QSI01405.1 16S rRNA (uracil(1498)-N(3))-methyltransferase [Treponema ruminis]
MRQYISQKNLDSKGLLTIIGKDYRYLRNVLRLVTGDMIHVRLASGQLQPMTVCQIDEKTKKITLQACDTLEGEEGENQPEETQSIESTEFTLFMAVPKSSKFDLIVRQATECGLARIIPVQTEFSQTGGEKMNFRGERFERIIKEARQQSGSPVSTRIEDCVTLNEACQIWERETENLPDSEKLALVLYERNDSTVPIPEACGKKENLKKIALFCGSEGGISPDEVKALCQSGFTAVHLKTNILRCETAALYGIAAIQVETSR